MSVPDRQGPNPLSLETARNILGALVLGLMIVLRHWFQAVIDELSLPERSKPRGGWSTPRGLRCTIALWSVVFLAFLVLGIWALIDAGYSVVAIVIVIHVAFLLEVPWRRPSPRRDDPGA